MIITTEIIAVHLLFSMTKVRKGINILHKIYTHTHTHTQQLICKVVRRMEASSNITSTFHQGASYVSSKKMKQPENAQSPLQTG